MAGSKSMKVVESAKPLISSSRYITTTTLPHRVSFPQNHQAVSDEYSSKNSSNSSSMRKQPPLSIIPLTSLVRSIAINSISSSPILLPPSLVIMNKLAHSHSPILNPDKNPILRYFLKRTFYAQFCAGENAQEVQRTVKSLKDMGFKGVMLGYAKEVVLDEGALKSLAASGETDTDVVEACIKNEILPWKKGTLETVGMTVPGDFVSVKFTGAGSQALFDLSRNQDPSPALEAAITEVCDLAASRGVRLLFDAEQQSLQAGIDAWTLKYMRRYNNRVPGKAVVHNTYQCYLKAISQVIASHLAVAKAEGFTLGAKLVRGAYIGSDPRHLINNTKAETDAQYDSIAECFMRRQYGAILKPAEGAPSEFPSVTLILAGHNQTSVHRALSIRSSQVQNGEKCTEMVYGQLQGMADEVSCELLQAAAEEKTKLEQGNKKVDVPQAYKYLVWGTTGECMKYLLRRAQENKDAVQRTREGRNAMVSELGRRIKSAVGF